MTETVTNQKKSPTVTRYQPLKMSQQTHGIPKKGAPTDDKEADAEKFTKGWAERNKPFFQ